MILFMLAGALTFAAEPTPTPLPNQAKDFAWLLKNATWDLYGSSHVTPTPAGTIKFLEGGKVEGTNIHYIAGWARVGGNKIKLITGNGSYWVYEYNSAGRQAKTIKERGSLGEAKLMKVQQDSIK